MTDMAVVHEEPGIADARQPAALDGADIHGHAFANGAAGPDLKPRRLTTIAEILRRPAEACERRDHAIIADRGVAHHRDVADQLAVLADHRSEEHTSELQSR